MPEPSAHFISLCKTLWVFVCRVKFIEMPKESELHHQKLENCDKSAKLRRTTPTLLLAKQRSKIPFTDTEVNPIS